MKTINKISFLSIIILFGIVFFACDKDDSSTEWGMAKIYMPQATIFDGGLTNNYPVPFNKEWISVNHSYDTLTHNLRIVLGVYRSGLQDMEAFSVKVSVDEDTTQIVAAKTPRGMMLPSEIYTLPTSVSVEKGQRENTFYLDVDLEKLVQLDKKNAAKRLVLVVGISNPTKYELNHELSKTVIIINTSDFLDPIEYIKGGNFESGSEEFWKIVKLKPNDQTIIEIKNGKLIFTNTGTGYFEGKALIYQPIELEKGITYQLKGWMTSVKANGGSFDVSFGKNEPEPLKSYGTGNPAVNFDNWDGSGALAKPFEGNMTNVAAWLTNIARDGTFTASTSETVYFVVYTKIYGNIGKITLDNLSIKKID